MLVAVKDATEAPATLSSGEDVPTTSTIAPPATQGGIAAAKLYVIDVAVTTMEVTGIAVSVELKLGRIVRVTPGRTCSPVAVVSPSSPRIVEVAAVRPVPRPRIVLAEIVFGFRPRETFAGFGIENVLSTEPLV